jgi:hypothetical protein
VVRRQDIFGDRGADDLRQALAAIFLRTGESRPAGFDELVVSLLEAGRSGDRTVVGALAADLVADLVERRQHLGRELPGLFQDRLDQVGSRVGEARQIRVAADVEDVVEDELGFAHRRGIGGHG